MTNQLDAQNNEYAASYSENSLWEKIINFAKNAGEELIILVLTLYYTLQDPDTPIWAKSVIIGALGYFISPIDAIPDIVPVVGFSDDLGVLTLAVTTVALCIKEEHRKSGKDRYKQMFC